MPAHPPCEPFPPVAAFLSVASAALSYLAGDVVDSTPSILPPQTSRGVCISLLEASGYWLQQFDSCESSNVGLPRHDTT